MSDENWVPFRAFTSLEQEMHELIERVGGRSWIDGFGWRPDTDIFRTESAFIVQSELPGIEPSRHLEVNIEDSVLQISGLAVQASDVTETDRFITERRYGPFHREVMLPDDVDPSAVTAVFANGVLTVRVAWSPKPGGRVAAERVRVNVSAGPAI